MLNNPQKSRKGQSLVEILVAFGIVAIVLGAVVTGIAVTLRSNLASRLSRSGSVVLQELMDRARITSAGDWHAFYQPVDKTLPTYVISDAGAFNFINGTEGVLEGDIISGLVGYWKLDEAGGTTAYDYTINNNKGTLIGGPTAITVSSCKIGRCLSFDGVNDRVRNPDATTSSIFAVGTGAFSMGAWVRPSTTSGTLTFMNLGLQAIGTAWRFNRVGGVWGIFDGTTSRLQGGSAQLNTWSHVFTTWDGTELRLYVNGSLMAGPSTPTPPNITTGRVTLGSHGGASPASGWWNGYIDDARVYNRALSATEVTQLFQSRVYVRSFIAEDVERNPGGNIITDGSVGIVDPSTQKITGTVVWGGSQLTATEYLTRSNSRVDVIDDWSDASTYSSQSNLNLTNPNEATLVED